MSRYPELGKQVYPSPTAGRVPKRIGITSFKRCVQCGAVNDTRSTGWAKKGDGISHDSSGDPTVSGGCWFCGSQQWQKSKPRKLPDDRDLETPDIRQRR